MAKVTNSISLGGSGGSSIIVVANYSALPDPTTVSGLFYWVSNSQGTKWLPGSLGGTYYNSGLYYSNGTTWEFMNVPYQATQLEVDTGTNTDKFVTPSTLSNSIWAFTTAKTLATLLTGISFATGGAIVSTDTVLIAFGKIQKQINDLSTVYQAILTDINFGAFSNSLSDKTTPVDADTINLVDSADSNKAKKLSFANLKAWVLSFVPTVITSETGIYYFNDFLGIFTTSTNDGNISSDGNVGQTTTALNSDTNKQGFANVNTTTASAGAGDIYIGHTATANFILGGGITSYETLIWLPNLSTSGERFSCLIGFSSGVANQNNSSNNIAFLYDEGNIAFAGAGGASANWRAVTIDSATRTFTDTGIAVNAGAFIKLKIVVNANASSVEFFIDNTLVATHTTNIPSGNTKRLNARNYIQKSVGYTTRLLILDYVKLQQTFTTAR